MIRGLLMAVKNKRISAADVGQKSDLVFINTAVIDMYSYVKLVLNDAYYKLLLTFIETLSVMRRKIDII